MKLTEVTLSSFRSFHDISFNLSASRVVVCGRNSAGKTTCADAIRWVLLGSCRGTDARGAGSERLIPQGESVADVSLGIEGIGRATRTYSPKGGGTFSVEGFTGSSQVQYQGLLMKLGTTPELLAATLDSGHFLDLPHAEAKALILSLLELKIQVGDRSFTLDELDARYKQAFEDRKVAKRVLANLTLPAKPDVSGPSVETCEGNLKTLRTELGNLREGIGTVLGRRQAIAADLERQRRSLAQPISPDQATDLEALRLRLQLAERQGVPPLLASGSLDLLIQRRNAVTVHHPSHDGCVLDPDVPCKTPLKAFRSRQEALTAEIKTQRGVEAQAASHGRGDSPEAIRRQIQAVEQNQTNRQIQAKATADAKKRIGELEGELSTLPDTQQQELSIAAINDRIRTADAQLSQARQIQMALAQFEKAKQEQQTQKAEVARLETIVGQLGPNGARVQALAHALGRFTVAIAPYLAPFGWTMTFSMDPWQITVNERSAETFSRSEQYRIGIAIQLAIAQLSKVGFAVGDEVDMLDLENRKVVTGMLHGAPVEQVILLGTREPDQALPKVKGCTVYRLTKAEGLSAIAETVTGI